MKNKIARARRKTLNEAFHNENGAIDLASIMVGIIVIGLIGGVIAATVFSVIPWTQDNAAKDQLSRVVQAEHAATTMNNGAYTENVSSFIDVQSVGATIISNDPSCYGAFLKSPSGKFFYASSKSSSPVQVPTPWPSAKPSNYPADCHWPSSGETVGQPMNTYTNFYSNPSFRNDKAQTETNYAFNAAVENSGDGTTLVATRTDAAAARVGLIAPIQSNQSYTIIMTVESTMDETLLISLRPQTIITANAVQVSNLSVKANVPQTVKFTVDSGSASYTNIGGLAVVSSATTADKLGTKLKIDNVAIIQNPSSTQTYPYNYFDGSTPGAKWDGVANNSTSTVVK